MPRNGTYRLYERPRDRPMRLLSCRPIVFATAIALAGLLQPVSAHAHPSPAVQCNERAAQFVKGKRYSDQLAEQARRAAGARIVRKLGPGQPATMDIRIDRLNLELNSQGMVVRVHCV